MARTFAGNSGYELTSAIITVPPVTFACWYRQTTVTTGALISVTNNLGSPNHERFTLNVNTANTRASFSVKDATLDTAAFSATGALVPSTWQHIVGVYQTSPTVFHRCYVNGTGGSTLSTLRAPANLVRTGIGFERLSTVQNQFTGDLAEVAIWTAVLNGSEIAVLSRGMPAWKVRPQSLVFYPPLLGLDALPTEPRWDKNGGTIALRSGGATPAAQTHAPIGLWMPPVPGSLA